jgi:hypothetical protein
MVLVTLGLSAVFFFAGCGMLSGPANEEVRQERNKTVYRSADRSMDAGNVTVSPREKIPGE